MQKTKICDECQSEYFSETSKMESLCPNCASLLYGYENCEHKFKKGRCIHCYWNGNVSDFLKEKLYQEKLGTLKFDFCQSLKKMEELANKLEQNHFATTIIFFLIPTMVRNKLIKRKLFLKTPIFTMWNLWF